MDSAIDRCRMSAFVPEGAALGTVLYILVPTGLEQDVSCWASEASRKLGWAVVLVSGMDWNDDMTPWPAPGVFRKAKPFGGRSQSFLSKLCDEYVPAVEASLPLGPSLLHGASNPQLTSLPQGASHPLSTSRPQGTPRPHEASLPPGAPARRILAGISLSGLFAVWAAHRTGIFTDIISVSGSLWYDGFADWVAENSLNPAVGSVWLSLGDRERFCGDPRMKTVQERTESIVRHLQGGRARVVYRLEEGITHFSPVVPRLEAAVAAFV